MHIEAGQPLTELHAVDEVVAVPPVDGKTVSEKSNEPVFEEMVVNVDPSVDEETKVKLLQLLQEFAPVLSRDETDMGLRSIVMH